MARYKTSEQIVSYGKVKGAGTDITVGSQEWFQWLETVSSFRYEDGNGDFAVQKRNGKYWNAVKRKIGDRRQEYLGKTSDLTADKLKEVSHLLNSYDATYRELRSEKRKQKCDTTESCITIRENSYCDTKEICTTDSSEPSRQREIEAIKQALDSWEAKVGESKAKSANGTPSPRFEKVEQLLKALREAISVSP
jgi:hypothetical protein